MNYTQVSREVFFESLHAEEKKGRDIMPRVVGSYPYQSLWADQRTRVMFGRTEKDKYFLCVVAA